MKNSQILKAAGFKTKRINTLNFKGVFGGTCNHVVVLVNSNNEVLNFENKPYYPCGRLDAFASLIKSGDISAKCFSFSKLSKN